MKIITNNKEVDISSLIIEDVHNWDFPNFSDSFISSGKDIDGNSLTGKELQELENEFPNLVNQLSVEYYWTNYNIDKFNQNKNK
jgi:hypothetical protein